MATKIEKRYPIFLVAARSPEFGASALRSSPPPRRARMSVWEGAELDNVNRTVSTNNSTSAISCVRGHPDLHRGDAEALGMTSDAGTLTCRVVGTDRAVNIVQFSAFPKAHPGPRQRRRRPSQWGMREAPNSGLRHQKDIRQH